MSARKLSKLFELIILVVSTYLLFIAPEKLMYNIIILIGCVFLIETICFSHEYFKYKLTKKIYVIKRRTYTLSIDNIVFMSLLVVLFIFIVLRWNSLYIDRSCGHFFTIITFLRSIFFYSARNSTVVRSGKLMFDNLFEKDIFLTDIKRTSIDKEKNNLIIHTYNKENIKIRLTEHFLNDENLEILGNVSKLKSIV